VAEKKEYTPKEVAHAALERIKNIAKSKLASLEKKETQIESLEKAAPQNQNSAQMAGIKVPQPPAPPAPEKIIAKPKEFKLKKFMDFKKEKKMKKKAVK